MKEIETILAGEIREPCDGELVRVHPSPEMRREVMTITHDGELYMVGDEMVAEVERLRPGRMKKMMMFVATNMKGEVFLWPVPAPVSPEHPAFKAIEHWISRGLPPNGVMPETPDGYRMEPFDVILEPGTTKH